MSVITKAHVDWAAQECAWQRSGELSVGWMIDGFLYAHRRRNHLPTEGDILQLGALVEPRHNRGFWFRQCDVRVDDSVKLDWTLVPNAIERLAEATPPLDSITEEEATEWFRQYEEIHPFKDGNGRTGNILYNWLRGSLDKPVLAPNLWDDSRRIRGSEL